MTPLKGRKIGSPINQKQGKISRLCNGCDTLYFCDGECNLKDRLKTQDECYCLTCLNEDYDGDVINSGYGGGSQSPIRCKSRGFP